MIPRGATIGVGIGAGVLLLLGAALSSRSSAAASSSAPSPRTGPAGPEPTPEPTTSAPTGITINVPAIPMPTLPAPPPPTVPVTPPAPGRGQWVDAAVLQPGDRVRVALAVADEPKIAQILGSNALQIIVSFFQLVQAQSNGTLITYDPGSGLPSDWPSDDRDPNNEVHWEFTFPGPQAVEVSWLGIPVQVWTYAS